MADSLPLHDLVDFAWTQWTSPGWTSLRAKDQLLWQVRHNQHTIAIPPDLVDRAEPCYVGICGEKVNRSKAIMRDPQGIDWTVAQTGTTKKADREREHMESWIDGAWRACARLSDGRDLEDAIRDDMLTFGRAWLRIQPNPAALSILSSRQSTKTLIDPEELDLLIGDGDEDDDEHVGQMASRLERESLRREELRRHVFAISAVFCPATNIIPRWDAAGLAEVIELRPMSVSRILADYRDEHGDPIAKQLEAAVQAKFLTEDYQATLVIRATRTHMQVAVSTLVLDSLAGSAGRRYGATMGAGTNELLFEGEHDLGVCPYVYFCGRETPADEWAYRWHPLIDRPVLDMAQALDRIVTQRLTVIRHAAWSGIVVQRDVNSQPPAGGDKPKKLTIAEGGVYTGLANGETLVRVPWFDQASIDLIKDGEAQLRADLDRWTFGQAAYGSRGAGSGYELAQLQAAAESVLSPFLAGFARGMSEAADLILRCGRWLLDHGVAYVPVRVVSDSGMEYLKLTPELADTDWEFKADIIPQPVGGEYAKFTTVKAMFEAGFISFGEAQRRMGIRNGQQQQEQWLAEQIARSPEVMGQIKQQVIARTVALMQQPETGGLPQGQVLMPPGLSQAFQQMGPGLTPEIAGRMPMGGIGGLPNLASLTGVSPSPMSQGNPVAQLGMPPLPGLGAGGPGGQPAGQAAPAPGGVDNMSFINGLREAA